MGYANPIVTINYNWPEHDFGNGDGALSFQGPSGLVGKMKDIIVHCTETFNAVTTPGKVQVGTSADPDAYALANLGTLADTDTFVASTDDTDWLLTQDFLAADTQIEVVPTAPTGGTPAGKGTVTIIVDWF
jgi:hypothetical protein